MDEIIRPRIIRYRMCYALFSVATSSLTGRGSSIEERGSRLSRYRGSSFRSLPPWCDPCVEDRTVSTSRALFSTRMLKDEKRLKNEVGVHENIRALGPVGRVSRGGTEHRRGCLIFSRGGELLFFFFFLTRRPGERRLNGSRVPAHHPAHNRPAAIRR